MDRRDAGTVGAAFTSGSAAVTATAAVACCIPVLSPLLVTVLGASGAVWVAGLRPYSPYLLAGSLVLLGYAFWRVYGRARECEMGSTPSRGRAWLARITLGLLWLTTLVWIAGVVAYLAFR